MYLKATRKYNVVSNIITGPSCTSGERQFSPTSICLSTISLTTVNPQSQGTSGGSRLNYTLYRPKFRNDYTDRVLIF